MQANLLKMGGVLAGHLIKSDGGHTGYMAVLCVPEEIKALNLQHENRINSYHGNIGNPATFLNFFRLWQERSRHKQRFLLGTGGPGGGLTCGTI